MFKEFEVGPPATKLRGTFYCFHDPAIEGKKKFARATTTAILLETGELFIGISVCSELDQFTKLAGRLQSRAHAVHQIEQWIKGKRAPWTVLKVPAVDMLADWPAVNKQVQQECLAFQVEKFREMLSGRSIRLNKPDVVWEA